MSRVFEKSLLCCKGNQGALPCFLQRNRGALAIWDISLWQWLALIQHEMLLFAGVFFLIGAADDIAIDAVWLWLKLSGRANTPELDRHSLQASELDAPLAVFIPAWDEAAILAETIAHTLKAWPQSKMRLYVGCYRNDSATMAAIIRAASADQRVRLVIHNCDGPTTKADCLNRLFTAMTDDERRAGQQFAGVVFQDAEDVVDPAALGLMSRALADGIDFAQLPVEPLVQPDSRWIGSHYCEEFAEAHGKAMVVRDALGAGLPGAGVGCAVSRRALDGLSADGRPFSADSLTEDYELGLAVAQNGGASRFIRARGQDRRLIATRAHFPARLDLAVRQKTRWLHGIALQGWDRTGWAKGWIEAWMRARDRRGPLTALVLLVGYSLIAVTLVGWSALVLGKGEPLELSPLVTFLLYANLAAFLWRAIFRFAFTARIYGVGEGLRAILRIPVANTIAIIAGRRAVFAYLRTLFGGATRWDKTPHAPQPIHPGALPVGAR